MSIRILLADDHTMVREALRALLEKEQDMSVVGEAGDGNETLELARRFSPDIVLMDVGMPNMDGIETTSKLLALLPKVKVIALSAHSEKRFVTGMLEAGAAGYIVKSNAGWELLYAIHNVMQDQVYLCPDVSAAMIESLRDGRTVGNKKLGRREKQVLQLLAEGLTSSEIGKRLNIAASTVEVHRRNIIRKLGLHGVAELTKYAIREGLATL